MKRTPLVAYRKSQVTPDTADTIRQLELKAAELGGLKLSYEGTQAHEMSWREVGKKTGPTGCTAALSMRPTGRELRLRIITDNEFTGPPEDRRRMEVETLWGLAVPLGLTPWLRYPLPGAGDDVFHNFGPWRPLYDAICGEGRGDEAWASLCCAAQMDVGTWEGERALERFVQAQVHRLGISCGPITGEITERTLEAMRALGVSGVKLAEAADQLAAMEPPATPKESRKTGHIIVPGGKVAGYAHGSVALTKNLNGYIMTIDGPGRVILDIGGDA